MTVLSSRCEDDGKDDNAEIRVARRSRTWEVVYGLLVLLAHMRCLSLFGVMKDMYSEADSTTMKAVPVVLFVMPVLLCYATHLGLCPKVVSTGTFVDAFMYTEVTWELFALTLPHSNIDLRELFFVEMGVQFVHEAIRALAQLEEVVGKMPYYFRIAHWIALLSVAILQASRQGGEHTSIIVLVGVVCCLMGGCIPILIDMFISLRSEISQEREVSNQQADVFRQLLDSVTAGFCSFELTDEGGRLLHLSSKLQTTLQLPSGESCDVASFVKTSADKDCILALGQAADLKKCIATCVASSLEGGSIEFEVQIFPFKPSKGGALQLCFQVASEIRTSMTDVEKEVEPLSPRSLKCVTLGGESYTELSAFSPRLPVPSEINSLGYTASVISTNQKSFPAVQFVDVGVQTTTAGKPPRSELGYVHDMSLVRGLTHQRRCVLPQFKPTPATSIKRCLNLILVHINPSGKGCCPAHIGMAKVASALRDLMRSDCKPGFSPNNAWQCNHCRCMNDVESHDDIDEDSEIERTCFICQMSDTPVAPALPRSPAGDSQSCGSVPSSVPNCSASQDDNQDDKALALSDLGNDSHRTTSPSPRSLPSESDNDCRDDAEQCVRFCAFAPPNDDAEDPEGHSVIWDYSYE
jgi:hypothetical protein